MALHQRQSLDDRVEAVVPAGAADHHGHEQEQAHQVAVDQAVPEPRVADPEQGHEDGPAEGRQPGERARHECQSDERLEQGDPRRDEPREVVPHPDRDGTERRASHLLQVGRPVGERQPVLDELGRAGVEEPPAGDHSQERQPVRRQRPVQPEFELVGQGVGCLVGHRYLTCATPAETSI